MLRVAEEDATELEGMRAEVRRLQDALKRAEEEDAMS